MGLADIVSLDTANKLYTLGWYGSIISAGITLIAILCLMVGTRVRDHHFEGDIAELHTKAAAYEKEAADTRKQTATLEKDAAIARSEQERLKAQLAWRRITKEQHDEIVSLIRDKVKNVRIMYPSADPEAMVFANDIGKTLQDAGVTLSGNAFLDTVPIFGLGISKVAEGKTPGSDWIALADAFRRAGWTFGLAEPAEELTITVGSKKPPF